jgi:hypothetical protein
MNLSHRLAQARQENLELLLRYGCHRYRLTEHWFCTTDSTPVVQSTMA